MAHCVQHVKLYLVLGQLAALLNVTIVHEFCVEMSCVYHNVAPKKLTQYF